MINNIIKKVINELKDNKNKLKEMEKIDRKYNNIIINLEDVIKYIENYKDMPIEKKNQKIIAIYRGNPYITIDLCMQAILNNCKIFLITEDVMFGVNSLIIKIFQQNTQLIVFKNLMSTSEIIKMTNEVDRIMVIGDITRYQILRKNIEKIEFKPYNNIAIYYDDEKFEELIENICGYADETEDDIEIYTRDVGDIAKDIFIEKVLILSEDKKLIEKAHKVLKDKTIIINKNPLEKLENKYYI